MVYRRVDGRIEPFKPTYFGTVSSGARLYLPLARYALQSLNLPHSPRERTLGAWLRIAQSPRILTDLDGIKPCADHHWPGLCLSTRTWYLGALRGFPQFDDLYLSFTSRARRSIQVMWSHVVRQRRGCEKPTLIQLKQRTQHPASSCWAKSSPVTDTMAHGRRRTTIS